MRVRRAVVRRPLREFSLKRRYLGLTSREVVDRRKLLQYYLIVSAASDERPGLRILRRIFWCKLVAHCICWESTTFSRNLRRRALISDFREEDIPDLFRFRTAVDIRRLTTAFLPQEKYGDASVVFPAEEGMLIWLFIIKYPCRLSDVGRVFGRDLSQVCRIFRFVTTTVAACQYLLTNIGRWVKMFPSLAQAVLRKAIQRHEMNADTFNVVGFIDNTLFGTCRPSGPNEVQKAFYSGWRRKHGLKWQTVEMPNGLTMHAFGGVSMRHNDNFTLAASGFVPIFRNAQLTSEKKYALYGDSAYLRTDWILSRHKPLCIDGVVLHELTRDQITENVVMSALRECVEWSYKDVKTLFAYVDYHKKLKLLSTDCVSLIMSALIMRNAHCCMYGNETSRCFELQPPEFEKWFSNEVLN